LAGVACGDDDSSSDESSQSGYGGNGGSGKAGSGGGGKSTRAGTGGSKSGSGGSSVGAAGRTSSTGEGGSGGTATSNNESGGRGAAGRGTAAGGTSAGGQGGESAAAGSGGSPAQAVLTDAEIASVLSAANEGEVQQNTVALSKAEAPEARAFAQDLINMHQAAQTRLNTLLTSLNITAADNAVAQQLRAASLNIVTTLQDATGAFDMTYLQSQIDVHIQVLNLIDQTLLPSAQNAQVRSELAVVRGEVAMHLARARSLAASLMLDVDAGTIDVDGGI
jgi:putative membrane protein